MTKVFEAGNKLRGNYPIPGRDPRLVDAIEAIHHANETEPGMGVLFSARMQMMAQAVLVVADRYAPPRGVHIVQRGESWHGIAKRLSGAADPGELLGLVQRLKEVNPGTNLDAMPPVGRGLVIPREWAERPLSDTTSPAGRQRTSLLAVDQMEYLRAELAAASGVAMEWRAIAIMRGFEFVRWAWAYYWKGEQPVAHMARRHPVPESDGAPE